MTTNMPFAHRLLAAFSAFAITTGLLLGSFAHAPQVYSVAGIIA